MQGFLSSKAHKTEEMLGKEEENFNTAKKIEVCLEINICSMGKTEAGEKFFCEDKEEDLLEGMG